MFIQDLIPLLVAVLAWVSALVGIFTLERFFGGKLEELFDNSQYFVFFFIVTGYFLYGLGELTFYLSTQYFKVVSLTGIQDIYWTFGAIFLAISFITLSLLLASRNQQKHKVVVQLLIALAMVILSTFLVGKNSVSWFSYFYPVASSLIVAFSFSAFLFKRELGSFSLPLKIFFIASFSILIGDIIFSYPQIGTIGDLFYLIGYGLSIVGFLTFRSKTIR